MAGKTQTAYEKARGFVPREELRGNVLRMVDELPEAEFHSVYDLLWHMTTTRMLYRHAESDLKELRERRVA